MCAPVFPITDLLDEKLCYLWLRDARWPGGKPICPKCGKPERVHRHSVEPNGPVEDFRCKECGCVFNVYTDTILRRTKRSCREVILVLRAGLSVPPDSGGKVNGYDLPCPDRFSHRNSDSIVPLLAPG